MLFEEEGQPRPREACYPTQFSNSLRGLGLEKKIKFIKLAFFLIQKSSYTESFYDKISGAVLFLIQNTLLLLTEEKTKLKFFSEKIDFNILRKRI